MTVSRYFLDSSIWIDYFLGEDSKIKEIIDSEHFLFTSVISLFELKKKIIKENIAKEKIEQFLSFMKERSIILKLDIQVCEYASELALKEKLHAMDALIYATSLLNKTTLVTKDNHFKNKEKVLLLK